MSPAVPCPLRAEVTPVERALVAAFLENVPHGFTTRAGGHGFGLHSSALAAKELKGSLTAQSGGPGTGATFVLDLPTP